MKKTEEERQMEEERHWTADNWFYTSMTEKGILDIFGITSETTDKEIDTISEKEVEEVLKEDIILDEIEVYEFLLNLRDTYYSL